MKGQLYCVCGWHHSAVMVGSLVEYLECRSGLVAAKIGALGISMVVVLVGYMFVWLPRL